MAAPAEPNYLSFFTDKGEVLCQEDVREADEIGLDVDGTLISSSYDTVALETVKILFGAFTGMTINEGPLKEALFKIKGVGGFANHWDATYALFMGLMSGLDEVVLKEIIERIESSEVKTLIDLSRIIRRTECKMDELFEGVRDVVDYVDERGLISVDEAFDRLYKNREKRNLLMKLKEVISYPGGPEKSILSRTFEELYYGGKKFRELYGLAPQLKMSTGLFEEEKLILRSDVTKFLKRKFGNKIGLLSGKRREAARSILGPLFGSFFNDRACFFLEDCEGRSKPDPKLLQLVLEALPSHSLVAYVGDSVEDLLLVQRLSRDDVVFVGVYGDSLLPTECVRLFVEKGANAILPSVNDLKVLFG